MSRHVKNTMDEIFNQLRKYVDEDDEHRIVSIQRHITADFEEEKVIDLVKFSRVHKIVYNSMQALVCEHNDVKYIALHEKYKEVFLEQINFDIVSDNIIIQGIGMLAISNGIIEVKHKLTSLDIINNCFGLSDENDDSNISFMFSEINQFFEPYSIFRILEDRFQVQFEQDFDRLYGYIMTINENVFLSNSLNRLGSILLLLSSRTIASSIINCIESHSKEYSFLQLYQCIEYLYIINNSLTLSKEYSISFEIAIDLLVAHRHKFDMIAEENLLNILKTHVPVSIIDTIFDDINSCSSSELNKCKAVSSYIYKIRCNIAHLRYEQDQILATVEWDKVIDYLSEIIFAVYQKLDSEIIRICSAKTAWQEIHWKSH